MTRGCVWAILLTLLTPGLSIATPAQRVISLAPHTTELFMAAGGRKQLVAAVPADEVLGPDIVRLNSFGGVDRELVLKLNPDLVIGWASGNRPSDIAWLRRQDIRVYLSEPGNLEQVARDLRAIGHLLGTGKAAARSAAQYLSGIAPRCGELPEQTVYIDVWDHPAMSIGGRHWLNDALSRVGLRNTFQSVERSVFSVEREALFLRSALPRLSLRDNTSLGSARLGRPGPLLAGAIQGLCEQRRRASAVLHTGQAGMAPR